MFRILDRYIVRETLGPLGLGLLVFTFSPCCRNCSRWPS